jgi:hypothetical protein
MDPRQQKGQEIAARMKITQILKGWVWVVPSQHGDGKYTVSTSLDKSPQCLQLVQHIRYGSGGGLRLMVIFTTVPFSTTVPCAGS